jgi:hypothetical protein
MTTSAATVRISRSPGCQPSALVMAGRPPGPTRPPLWLARPGLGDERATQSRSGMRRRPALGSGTAASYRHATGDAPDLCGRHPQSMPPADAATPSSDPRDPASSSVISQSRAMWPMRGCGRTPRASDKQNWRFCTAQRMNYRPLPTARNRRHRLELDNYEFSCLS